MELTEAKKLNGVVRTAEPCADARGSQRQPEGVGPRRAAEGVGHAQLAGSGLLKGGNLLAKNELLRLKHMAHRLQQFLVQGLVLALQVEHGNGLGGLVAGLRGGIRCVLHANYFSSWQRECCPIGGVRNRTSRFS